MQDRKMTKKTAEVEHARHGNSGRNCMERQYRIWQ